MCNNDTIRLSIAHLEKALGEANKFLPISEMTRDTIHRQFAAILTSGETPNNHWSYMDCGAFKECYSLSEYFIIKFASLQNPTDREEKLISVFKEAGVEQCLIPTWFIPLPDDLVPLVNLVEESDDAWTWDESIEDYTRNENYKPYATHAIIQPKLWKTLADVDFDDEKWISFLWHKNPISTTADGTPFETNDLRLKLGISDSSKGRAWVKDFTARLTNAQLETLLDLVDEFNIWDLNSGNVGWFDDPDRGLTPYIIDWISD